MTRFHRSFPSDPTSSAFACGLLALCVAIVSVPGSVDGNFAYGQPPAAASPQPPVPNRPSRNQAFQNIEPSDLPAPVPPAEDPEAAEIIQRVLKGDHSQTAPGMLGDVLEIIRDQGSILDGSVLDQPDHFLGGDEPFSTGPDVSGSATQNRTQTVKTAEALLRTARMLESLTMKTTPAAEPTDEPSSAETLVEQMRIQATRMLLTEFPQAARSRFDQQK